MEELGKEWKDWVFKGLCKYGNKGMETWTLLSSTARLLAVLFGLTSSVEKKQRG